MTPDTPDCVFQRVADEVRARRADGRPVLLGISGPPTAGKTTMARALAAFLEASGAPTLVVHVDDFTNPKAIRYAGDREDENFYALNVDFEKLTREILEPARSGRQVDTELLLLDVATDELTERRRYVTDPGGVVIVEGALLFRREIRRYFDCTIFVRISNETALRRAPTRFTGWPHDEILRRMTEKYLPGHRLHLERDDPEAAVDFIVDNESPDEPLVVRGPPERRV